jgi:hypothetical protein
MAITLISSPAIVQQAYNPIYYNVISTNVAQPNFQYVFNLYSGGTIAGSPVSTINLLPRPTSNCLYNPARILESWVSADQGIQGITGLYPSPNMIKEFTVDFGEQYGGNLYTGTNHTQSFVFNGVLQYKDIPNWSTNYIYYLMTNAPNNNYKFLTNQPRSGVLTLLTDIGTLSWMGFQPNQMRVLIQGSGPFTSSTFLYVISLSASTTGNTFHIPIGPVQLNPLIGTHKIDSGTTSYQIYLYDTGVGGQISEMITYIIDQSCSKYSNMRIQFLNPYGAWDYVNFRMKSKETVNVTNRTLYKKVLPYNYTVGAREQTQIDFDGYTTYTVTSDWVSDDYSKWFKELMRAQQINIIESSGDALPVNIVETSDYVQTVLNDSLPQYIFNFNTAYSINAARG